MQECCILLKRTHTQAAQPCLLQQWCQRHMWADFVTTDMMPGPSKGRFCNYWHEASAIWRQIWNCISYLDTQPSTAMMPTPSVGRFWNYRHDASAICRQILKLMRGRQRHLWADFEKCQDASAICVQIFKLLSWCQRHLWTDFEIAMMPASSVCRFWNYSSQLLPGNPAVHSHDDQPALDGAQRLVADAICGNSLELK